MNRKSTLILFIFLLVSLSITSLFFTKVLLAQKCPDGSIWVPGHRAAGKFIPGHCKLIDKPIEKICPEGETLVGGACTAIEEIKKCPEGNIWIPGHRGKFGKWIPGHCKP